MTTLAFAEHLLGAREAANATGGIGIAGAAFRCFRWAVPQVEKSPPALAAKEIDCCRVPRLQVRAVVST
jgi:hypothetical protein